MLVTLLDAKGKLEAEGLHVSYDPHSLWIAATLRDVGGIRLSDDACCLNWHSGRWVAVFPAEGQQTYEVPGALGDLVAVITAVYAYYRDTGTPFKDAVKQVVTDAEQYLVGRLPAQA